MRYRVRYRKEGGGEEERVTEAANRFDVYAAASAANETAVAIEEVRGGIPRMSFRFGFGRIPDDQIIAFAKNLSAMLSAGLPLSRALSIIIRQSDGTRLIDIAKDLEARVRGGAAFHEALAAHPQVFSNLFVAMTKAGEESGELSEALAIVARQMGNVRELMKRVKSAMIYPSFILIAIFVISFFMLTSVVPTLAATFTQLDVELPMTTRIIVGLSSFLIAHTFLVLGGVILFVALIVLVLRSRMGGRLFIRAALHAPVIGNLLQETYSARAARTLASLLASGVPMLTCIAIAEDVVGNRVFAQVLAETRVRVQKGETLSAVFSDHHDLYPYLFSDMIMVGEETGKLAEMLGRVAEYYETDVNDRTKDLSSVIEPALMLVIGVMVGIFAISMIGPIYSLTAQIG